MGLDYSATPADGIHGLSEYSAPLSARPFDRKPNDVFANSRPRRLLAHVSRARVDILLSIRERLAGVHHLSQAPDCIAGV